MLRERPRIVGGRDLEKGGTWMGLTPGGLVVALTNQRTGRAPDRTRRSRGEVVVEALACGSVDSAAALVAGLDPSEHNAFNLLIADADRALVAYARDDAASIEIEDVPAGVHVLPNDRLDADGWPKVERALRSASRVAGSHPPGPLPVGEGGNDGAWAAMVEDLRAMLADHRTEPPDAVMLALAQERAERPAASWLTPEVVRALDALCIHTPVYGTRSATLVALEPGRVAQYLFAEGPPCTTPFRDVRALLEGAAP